MTIDVEALLARMTRRDKLDQLQVVWRRDLEEAKALARRGIGALFWPGAPRTPTRCSASRGTRARTGSPCSSVSTSSTASAPPSPSRSRRRRASIPRWPTDAAVTGAEAAPAGVNWTFSPMIDVARDPRWGRIAESFGEDPLVASGSAPRRCAGTRATTSPRRARSPRPRSTSSGTGPPREAGLQHRGHVGAAAAERVPPAVPGGGRRRCRGVMAAFNTLSGVPMHAQPTAAARRAEGGVGLRGRRRR